MASAAAASFVCNGWWSFHRHVRCQSRSVFHVRTNTHTTASDDRHHPYLQSIDASGKGVALLNVHRNAKEWLYSLPSGHLPLQQSVPAQCNTSNAQSLTAAAIVACSLIPSSPDCSVASTQVRKLHFRSFDPARLNGRSWCVIHAKAAREVIPFHHHYCS